MKNIVFEMETSDPDDFMTLLWHEGGIAGKRPQEAWFVHCGLGSTMTQDDIDQGRAIIEVGFAALRPAEFVILRFALATVGAAA